MIDWLMREGEVKAMLYAHRTHKGELWEIGSQDFPLEGKCNEREPYFTRKNQKEKKEQGKMNLIK